MKRRSNSNSNKKSSSSMSSSSSSSPSSAAAANKNRKDYKKLSTNADDDELTSPSASAGGGGGGELQQHQSRVIFIWGVPANGHMNPTLCFTNKLITRLKDMNVEKIIFYCGPDFKDRILNLPNNTNNNFVEYRDYRLEEYTGTENLLMTMMNFDTRPGTLFRVFQLFENAVKLGAKHIIKNLLEDIHRDRPVLILYDQALFFPKLALQAYAKKYPRAPRPLHATYVTTFMCARDVYPLWHEMVAMGFMGKTSSVFGKLRNGLVTAVDFLRYMYNYYKIIWWDLGFSLWDIVFQLDGPLGRNHIIDESLNIVFVAPEIQPRLEGFTEYPNVKFTGPCIDESVRATMLSQKTDVNMKKYTKQIEEFLAKNAINTNNTNTTTNNIITNKISSPIAATSSSSSSSSLSYLRMDSTGENFKLSHRPIIYVSMGTVFNRENSDLFRILVGGCKYFADKYAIIVSTGDEKTYAKYADDVELNSGNILIVPHTPQVEILKRSHLFLTHAGMNSVSEAITYGVPIICLPLSGDQPFVAWRLCDELKMGIRLDADRRTLTSDKVRDAVHEILTNPVYVQNAKKLSTVSNGYDGTKIASNLLIDFVNKSEQQNYNDNFISSDEENNNIEDTTTTNEDEGDANNNKKSKKSAQMFATARV